MQSAKLYCYGTPGVCDCCLYLTFMALLSIITHLSQESRISVSL